MSVGVSVGVGVSVSVEEEKEKRSILELVDEICCSETENFECF